MRQIADYVGSKPTTIHRDLKQLVADGALVVTRPGLRQSVTRYEVSK